LSTSNKDYDDDDDDGPVTRPFDLGTGQNVSCGTDNLPSNFGVSAIFVVELWANINANYRYYC